MNNDNQNSKEEEIIRQKGLKMYAGLGAVWLLACGVIAGGFAYTAVEREQDALKQHEAYIKETCREESPHNVQDCFTRLAKKDIEQQEALISRNQRVGYSLAGLFLLGAGLAGSKWKDIGKRVRDLESNDYRMF